MVGRKTPTRKRQLLIRPIAPSLPRPNYGPRQSPAETSAHALSLRPRENTRTMSGSSHSSLASTETFQPRATLRYTSAVGIQAAGVGAVVSAVQNALSSHNHGAFGVFTRTGGTIGFFGTSSFEHTCRLELNWNHPIGRPLGTLLNLGAYSCNGCCVRSDGIGGG